MNYLRNETWRSFHVILFFLCAYFVIHSTPKKKKQKIVYVCVWNKQWNVKFKLNYKRQWLVRVLQRLRHKSFSFLFAFAFVSFISEIKRFPALATSRLYIMVRCFFSLLLSYSAWKLYVIFALAGKSQ